MGGVASHRDGDITPHSGQQVAKETGSHCFMNSSCTSISKVNATNSSCQTCPPNTVIGMSTTYNPTEIMPTLL